MTRDGQPTNTEKQASTPQAQTSQAGEKRGSGGSKEKGRADSGNSHSLGQGSSSTLSGESPSNPSFQSSGQSPGSRGDDTNATIDSGNNSQPPGSLVGEGSNQQAKSSRSDNEMREILDGIIAQLQRGAITKLNATSRVCEFIQSFTTVGDETKEVIIGTYLGEINATETRSSPKACTQLASEERCRQPTSRSSRARSPEARTNRSALDEFIESVANESRPGSPDGEDAHISKRRRLKRSQMPWFTQEQSDSFVQRPSCTRTTQILELFNGDLQSVKFFIKTSPSAPQGFPLSQWKRIFRGEPVDLDHVFSSLHRVTIDEERKGKIGESTINLGTSEASKKVKTAADWATAWRRAARATTFAFNHRERELNEYGDYIERHFAAKHQSSHASIILYDAAIRTLVGGGQHTLLTDHDQFTHLYAAIVMSDGVDHVSATSARRPIRSGSRTEICNKFNAGFCNFKDDCRFLHLCKKCGKSGHGKHDCPTNESRK
ncbi:hypothetical protein CVT26_009369 [Gymnopilus dilepis]|uniref:CCHC-type domain-containing protein n=1 Tax=Gymnopilus dilepis TaxID=231916 RepID=A0A409WZI5_9AGAR|nr:hypothetical protein CVT26_009369 [Gymnopilus dilepis]